MFNLFPEHKNFSKRKGYYFNRSKLNETPVIKHAESVQKDINSIRKDYESAQRKFLSEQK